MLVMHEHFDFPNKCKVVGLYTYINIHTYGLKPDFFLLFVVEYMIELWCYQNQNWDGVCECKLRWKSMVYNSTLYFLFTLKIFVYRDSKCIYLSLDWQNKSQTFLISKPFHFWSHFFGILMQSGTVKSNKPFTFTLGR